MSAFYLGIDPGDTTGITLLDRNGVITQTGQYSKKDFMKFLSGIKENVKVIVMEDYVTYRHKALQQTGSRQGAAQVIGMVKMWAGLKGGIPIELQRASILPIAEKWSKITMKGISHDRSHWISAYLHVYYYMVQRQLIKPNVTVRKK